MQHPANFLMSRVHCAALNVRNPHLHRWGWRKVHSVTAVMAKGKRPVSFRTRKLSLSAPMVLPGGLGGRVGRRRTSSPGTGVGALRSGSRFVRLSHSSTELARGERHAVEVPP